MNLVYMAGTDGWPSECLDNTSMVFRFLGLLGDFRLFVSIYDTCGGAHA